MQGRHAVSQQGGSPALPYRSEEAEAAVGLVLATLSVAVSAMKTLGRGMPRAWAATCATLVCRPWPTTTHCNHHPDCSAAARFACADVGPLRRRQQTLQRTSRATPSTPWQQGDAVQAGRLVSVHSSVQGGVVWFLHRAVGSR